MRIEAGNDATILVPLIVDGEFVVPDANSAAFLIRGADGTVLVPSTTLTTTPTTTTVAVQTLAANNTTTAPAENRFVVVTFAVSGRPHRIVQPYTLVPWVNIAATPDQVRREIGVSPGELPDKDIDLLAAYLELVADFDTEFTSALAGTGQAMLKANRAIVLKAALDIIHSLQLRIAQSEKSDDVSMARLSRLDFAGLQKALSQKLSECTGSFTAEDAPAFVLSQIITGTDPITGG